MRISGVQSSVAFSSLQQKCMAPMHITEERLENCRKQLANTKFVDVVLDSHGLAIKEKMTEFVQRIRSFSLLPQENAVSINMTGDIENAYKFKYSNLNKAKEVWHELSRMSTKNNPEYYTEIALWLDRNFKSKN